MAFEGTFVLAALLIERSAKEHAARAVSVDRAMTRARERARESLVWGCLLLVLL